MTQNKKPDDKHSFEYSYFDKDHIGDHNSSSFLLISDNLTQTKRTKQLMIAVFVLVVTAFIINLYHFHFPTAYPIYATILLLVVLCYLIVNKGYLKLGSYLFVWLLYAGVTALLLNHEGLRNPVVIAYTGNLVFAAMIASRRLFLSLCITIGLTIIGVGFANAQQWIVFSGMSFDFMIAVDLLLIYIVISYGIWTLTGDLRHLLQNLDAEHQKVTWSSFLIQPS